MIVPLPNANNLDVPPEKAIRRGLLLLKTFPEVIPDTPFQRSLLGNAYEELRHVENLPQRVPIVLAAGLVAAAAIGLGDLVVRRLRVTEFLTGAERIALAYGVGAGLLGVVTLVLGRVGWLNPWLFRVGLAMTAAISAATLRPWRKPVIQLSASTTLLADCRGPFRHRDDPRLDAAVNRFRCARVSLAGSQGVFSYRPDRIPPHNVYTSMPFGVEMLHLAAMEVMGDWWWGGLAGQLLVALFASGGGRLDRRDGGARGLESGGLVRGGCLPLDTLDLPPGRDRIRRGAALLLPCGARVDGCACLWRPLARTACRVVAGWPARGLGDGLQIPGLISAVIPFGVLSLFDSARSRSWAPVLWYALGCGVVIGPWLAKNVGDTGNPVYPLANSIFHGRYWDDAREQKWTSAHGRRPYTFHELTNAIVDVAGRSDWQSPLYAALAPLALLRVRSRKLALGLWAFVIYLFATWWLLTHRLDRFWLPLLPPLAVLAGLGADWTRSRGWSILLGIIMTIALIMNLTYITTALAGLNEWTADLVHLRKNLPERWNAALASLDHQLPPDAHPLIVGQAAVFHLEHFVAFNTVFDVEIIEALADGKSDEEFHESLRQRNLTHIYVDWKEIGRHRQPGGYGYTSFVQPWRFERWVAAGVLEAPRHLGAEQELYKVR